MAESEAKDASEHAKQIENDLFDSERRFQAVFDNAIDGMLVADDSMQLVDANRAACELTGYTKSELLSLRILDLVMPELQPHAAGLWREFRGVGKLQGELTLLRGDGTQRLVEFNANADIVPGRHLAVLHDIEARKRAESSLKFLAEASAVLASSLDYHDTLSGMARLVVASIADFCSVDMLDADGALRRIALEHADPDRAQQASVVWESLPDSAHATHGMQRVVNSGRPELLSSITDAQWTSVSDDPVVLQLGRSLGLVSAMCVPLRVRGRTVGAISIAAAESARHFDAGDLALAMELAARANVAIDNARSFREAQDANRLKDEFLATMSHELRTPLNAIMGWATLLQTDGADPALLSRGLETILRNSKAQVRLIDDVLDVSRIIVGKLRLEWKTVDVLAVARAALDVVGPTAAAKGVKLDLHTDAQQPAIFGDGDRLQQVIWNLVSNAIKFTPKGGRVRIDVAQLESSIRISVADTGAGIEHEFLPYVFDRFRQADSSTTRRHGGLGLGLAIARHLVELHGGSISVDSAGKHRGTTFTVLLPIRALQIAEEPQPDRARAPSDRPPAAPVLKPELSALRVLVCDDQRDARELIVQVLSQHGACVKPASSAEETLRVIEDFRPDVLVSDIGMPDVDGYGLIRNLRARSVERFGQIPAIALTAYARSGDAKRALDAGFSRHLTKPVDPHELVAIVANLGSHAVH